MAVVATTWKQSEAEVIRSLLQGYGIPCDISCRIPRRIYPLATDGLEEIRIVVPAELEEEAVKILAAHRHRDSPLRPV